MNTTESPRSLRDLLDPIMAIEFAVVILIYIDFSQKLISGTLGEIKAGSTTENYHVSVVINDLQYITKELSDRPLGYSKHNDSLNALACKLQNLSKELQKLLEKVNTTAKDSKWKEVKEVLRLMRNMGDLDADFEKPLNEYRLQILTQLSLMLKYAKASLIRHVSDH